MNIPRDLDIETVTVTDLVGALSPFAPDVAAQVSNFESIDDVVMFDVWTAEETAQIEMALRGIVSMRETVQTSVLQATLQVLEQSPAKQRAHHDFYAFIDVQSNYISIGGPALVRRR